MESSSDSCSLSSSLAPEVCPTDQQRTGVTNTQDQPEDQTVRKKIKQENREKPIKKKKIQTRTSTINKLPIVTTFEDILPTSAVV